MFQYNPKFHNRRSNRLKGYDYSQAGMYFITICCQNRESLFGDVLNGEMVLNDAGKMVELWYFKLENKFPDIKCNEMVVMPDHFHCIIENDRNVGADLCVDLNVNYDDTDLSEINWIEPNDLKSRTYEQKGSALSDILQWFKTMTTNKYIDGVKSLDWQPFVGKLWQRNYHEHIIRNKESYQHIAEYIINNPTKWELDKFYKTLNSSQKMFCRGRPMCLP